MRCAATAPLIPSGPQQQRMVLRQPVGTGGGLHALERAAQLAFAQDQRGARGRLLGHPEGRRGNARHRLRLRASAFADAGLPAGVVNLVFGEPAQISTTLIASPVIRMITLTGSVAVGKHLAQLAGAAMKPALLELGAMPPC
jgi:succinate-semialdehyde dehydrogenase/glutarate-semialdehyde dehydrogenase